MLLYLSEFYFTSYYKLREPVLVTLPRSVQHDLFNFSDETSSLLIDQLANIHSDYFIRVWDLSDNEIKEDERSKNDVGVPSDPKHLLLPVLLAWVVEDDKVEVSKRQS